MQQQLRHKLESAALRLDDFLNSSTATALGAYERTVLSAARDLALAIEMFQDA
jgi:hypothetical protein